MSHSQIYLDANATTPVFYEIANSVMHSMQVEFGNPSSSHITGLKAKRLMEDTRLLGQKLIGGEKGRLLFTSGATEGIQTSIVSALVSVKDHTIENPVLLYGATEHKAVPNTLKHWNEMLGINATIIAIPVDENGTLDHQFIAKHINKALMICTMIVNNETGVIQDIPALDKVIRDNNPSVLWMVDCVQGLGKQLLNLDDTSINYAPFSGHKLYAPKGIGFLYLSDNAPLTPFIAGGGQESGARSGTENIPGIAALKKLFELMTDGSSDLFKSISVLSQFREKIKTALQHTFDDIVFNNDFQLSVPTTLNFSVSNMSGSEVMNLFDSAGIRVSAGSACSAGAASSFVLEAMRLSRWRCENAIRLSFGPMVTECEIDTACQRISQLKDKLAEACMLSQVNKETPCAVGVNQYVVGDQLMYLIVNHSLNAVLFNPIESELEKINRLIAKQGISINLLISDKPSHSLPCGVDVLSIIDVTTERLAEFELAIEQGELYLVTEQTKWPLTSDFSYYECVKEITGKDLSNQVAQNKIDLVLDIREQYEHQEGELNDYLAMPNTQIKNIPAHRLLNEFLVGNLSDQQHYVLVCRSGRRSNISCQLLNSFGLSRVNNLRGGVAFL